MENQEYPTLLTDEQWGRLSHLFPNPQKRGRGKPHTPWRAVLNSILYVVLTKAKWGSLPKSVDFASKSATHRWYLFWKQTGMLDQILKILQEAHPRDEFVLPQQRAPYMKGLQQQEAIA